MNSILLYPEEVGPGGHVELRGARARHAIEDFHDVAAGVSIPASVHGGGRGRASYHRIAPDLVELIFEPTTEAMPRNPITLIVAVSRPQTIKKVIQAAVFLGVEQLLFVRTDLTEKSYLSSRELRPERTTLEVERALEQCCDSIAPVISVHRTLREVMENASAGRLAFFADTVSSTVSAPHHDTGIDAFVPSEPVSIAIGPEKGWSPREQHLFLEKGFRGLSLGERVLRVDAAVYVAVTALMPRRFVSVSCSSAS